jgi:hypothetical protein
MALESEIPTIGPIQLVPPGLMGLLQLKSTGRLPGELSGAVRPSLELFTWYMASRVVDIPALPGSAGQPSVAIPTATQGFNAFTTNPLIVPNGQWWWVESFTVQALIGVAADTIGGVAPGWTPNLGAAPVQRYMVGRPVDDVATAQVIRTVWSYASAPFFAPPGAQFGCFNSRITTATSITLAGFVRATVLPI